MNWADRRIGARLGSRAAASGAACWLRAPVTLQPSYNGGMSELSNASSPTPDPVTVSTSMTDRKIIGLKRRLVREASTAVGMLEDSLAALWDLDVERARAVRIADDAVDAEEVEIEQQCHELLALHKPFARDFRILTFILKTNADLERVADHASSISKITIRLAEYVRPSHRVEWPTALIELGERVPAMCHELLRAVLDENVERARELVASDKVIDQLERRLFEENIERLLVTPREANDLATGMLLARLGRELERVGDLMANIAEDVVYVGTGEIVRHAKRRGVVRGTKPPSKD